MLGFIVGLRAEAALLRGIAPVAISGATRSGAEQAVARLIGAGVTELVSLGLAAGLDPMAMPGDVLVPTRIVVDGIEAFTDAALCARLGGVTAGGLLHSDRVVGLAAEKRALHEATGCVALDMESGVMALAAQAAGLPFAALRAICDPATGDLPAAALIAVQSDGRLAWAGMLKSLLGDPGQIPALLKLARDAASARRALARRIRERLGSAHRSASRLDRQRPRAFGNRFK